MTTNIKETYKLCIETKMFTEIIVKTQFKIKELLELSKTNINPSLLLHNKNEFLREQKLLLIDAGVKVENIKDLDINEFLEICIKALDMTFKNMEQAMEDE